MSKGSVQFHDLHPTANNLLGDVLEGISQNPRSISPKYFYDERGSQLFDAITETEDYYPTRTEVLILQKYKQEIVQSLSDDCLLIEPGGGNCSKVRIFIDSLRPCAYVPMDISKQHLLSAAHQMAAEIPWLQIHAACSDFTLNIQLPKDLPTGPRVVFFPGSSIGNFHPVDAVQYLSSIAQVLSVDGQLLIGVDLKKDKQILERAYNDTNGMTAEFNLNVLARMNRELSANFDLSSWSHHAFYNEELERIEMHLKSLCEQTVQIDDHEFCFVADENLHTENSYKYSVDEFQKLASEAGLVPEKVWLDDNNLFSVHLFSVTNN